MNIKEILKISRPRFWLYEGATFALIGALAGATNTAFLHNPIFWIFALYFLIPANILIYGINDIFDYETDKLNPKKGTYEALVAPDRHKKVWIWILATNIPFLFFVPHTPALLISFCVFIFCASFYSAKPIRAKARPIIDSLFSAGHYIATGIFGYYLAGGTHFPVYGFIAGMLWATAMHAYSAVPDIDADKQAGLKTIAILIGKKPTILLCWLLYVLSAVLVFQYIPIVASIGAVVFSYFMYRSYKSNTDEELFKLYTYFPLINSGIGMLVSLTLMYTLANL